MALERYPTSVFMPEMSLDLLRSVGISDPLLWADIDFCFIVGHRFCLFMLQPPSFPFLSMAAAVITVAAYSLIIAFRLPENVGASVCTLGKKPADYGYFIFPVSIRRR